MIELKEEEQKYLLEKWNYMRTFFDAEFIIENIEEVNCNFYHKLYLKQRKIHYDKNAEKLRKQARENYYKNHENALAQGKKYRETHKEQIAEKNKTYRQENKEKINERKREIIKCECGVEVSKGTLHKHKQTNRHFENLNKR